MVTRKLHAMGTEFAFLVDASPTPGVQAALDEAAAIVRRLETRLSRFLPDSELSVLNRDGRIEAGDDLLVLTQLSLDARRETGGRFDPTVHRAVVAAGYDRSFDELPADTGPARAGGPAACGGRVDVDLDRGTIRLAPGVGLDLGGIAKGYAAEVVCDRLASAGPCLVNAGGDIATRGRPQVGAWAVEVPTPDSALTVGVRQGALATSGRDRRRWRSGGELCHHIIDPSTSRPAATDVLRATAFAGSAVRAEALATAFVLAGADGALAEAAARDIPAIVVTDDGRTLATAGLA